MTELQRLPDSNVRYRLWAHHHPQAVVLLIHGLGAYTGRWEALGKFLSGHKLSAYAIELQGFGNAPGPRGHIDSFALYYQDILQLRAFIQKSHPRLPVFLLGESMGGLMAFNLAVAQPVLFRGVILISPVFKSILKFPLPVYLQTFAALLYQPSKTVPLPFTSAMCTQDEAFQRKLDADPCELRVASAKLLIGILLEQLHSSAAAKKLTMPVLFLLSGQDEFGDEKTSRRMFASLPAPDKTLVGYPSLRHALSIELGKEKVFNDIRTWLQKRM
jgi:alpha-beta hydrolase superfamily lysophospholipase